MASHQTSESARVRATLVGPTLVGPPGRLRPTHTLTLAHSTRPCLAMCPPDLTLLTSPSCHAHSWYRARLLPLQPGRDGCAAPPNRCVERRQLSMAALPKGAMVCQPWRPMGGFDCQHGRAEAVLVRQGRLRKPHGIEMLPTSVPERDIEPSFLTCAAADVRFCYAERCSPRR